MTFIQKCEVLSVEPLSFVNNKGEEISYFKGVLLVGSEIVEINFRDKERFQELKANERKEVSIEFRLIKNRYGAYKLSM